MWPIIKKAVNSDLSTPLNIPINAIKAKTDLLTQVKAKTDLITGDKCKLFLANATFVVPAGVNAVYLTGCAAGNAGANGTTGAGGAGGAGGEMIFDFLIPNITPGQSITVTVGTGNTSFGTHLTLAKGAGAAGGNAGAKGDAGKILIGIPYNGGAGGAAYYTGSSVGGGGGGAFGIGGNGGYDLGEYVAAAQPGTGCGTGGGGGSKKSATATGAGGAGRPGFLFVRWL